MHGQCCQLITLLQFTSGMFYTIAILLQYDDSEDTESLTSVMNYVLAMLVLVLQHG